MTNIRAIDELAARWHARAMIGQLAPEDEQRLDAWLAGVTTFDGKPGLAAVKEKLGL